MVVESELLGSGNEPSSSSQFDIEYGLFGLPTGKVEDSLGLPFDHHLLDQFLGLLHGFIPQHDEVVVDDLLINVDDGCLILDDLFRVIHCANDFMLKLTHILVVEDDQTFGCLHHQRYELQLKAVRLASFQSHQLAPTEH